MTWSYGASSTDRGGAESALGPADTDKQSGQRSAVEGASHQDVTGLQQNKGCYSYERQDRRPSGVGVVYTKCQEILVELNFSASAMYKMS